MVSRAKVYAGAAAAALVSVLVAGGPARADAPPTTDCGATPSACPQLSTATPQVHQLLAVTHGLWSGSPTPTFTYQWQKCTSTSTSSCGPIDGETESTLLVPTSGLRYRAVVTATNVAGSASVSTALSASAAANSASWPGSTQLVAPKLTSLSGDVAAPVVGDTLDGGVATFDPAGTSTVAQWRRCVAKACVDVSGATARQYAVSAADVGATLSYRVTATNAGGTSRLESADSGTVAPAPAPAPVAHVAFTGKRKQRLAATVEAEVDTDRPIGVTASGTLLLSPPQGRAAKVKEYSLGTVTAQLTPGRTRVLALRLSRKVLRLARKALTHGGKVRATVEVTGPGLDVRRTYRLVAAPHH